MLLLSIDDFKQRLQGHDDDLMSTLISKPAASVTTEVGQLLAAYHKKP